MSLLCDFNESAGRCVITDQEIPPEVNESTFDIGAKKRDKVHELQIQYSTFTKFPDEIGNYFKNVTFLLITSSNLKEISKENLRSFPKLYYLCLMGSSIEFLPGDLFEYNEEISQIKLNNNKIKYIAPDLLDNIINLTRFEIMSNPTIHNRYDKCSGIKMYGSLTLQEMKDHINLHCKPPPELLAKAAAKKTPGKAHHVASNQNRDLIDDLTKFLTLDDFKDFTIKVDSRSFIVHKFLFLARSQTFAEMIKNNPDADELVLTDIPVHIFEAILRFVYTDEPPKDTINARGIFAAAGKLEIEKLKEISAEILMKEMENENLDVLMENFNLGIKFECQKLKLKAFERIKGKCPGRQLKNELLEQPDKLKKLVEAIKVLDEFDDES